MPELTAADFDLQDKTPQDLQARRGEIERELRTKYAGPEDPTVPLQLLHELVVITSMLRRGTAGPPKPKSSATKAKPSTKRSSIDDLASDLGV